MKNKQESQTPTENDSLISPRQLLLLEIAYKLEQARTAKGQNITKAVSKLKISASHLQALESGNWDVLPDDVYVIGFLRQYSKFLSVDLTDEINRLKNSDYTLTRPLTFSDPPVAPSRLWAWLTGGAFIILFILFNVISSDNNQEETVQSEPAQLIQKYQQEPTVEASIKPGSDDVINHTVKNGNKTALLQQKPAAATQTSRSAMVATTAPKTVTKSATILHRVKAPAQGNTQKQLTNSPIHLFRFEAVTAPVWMQVFLPNKAGDGKGRLLKEMLLKKGHFANIRYATETLWITCGNALALRIKVDRKTIVKTGELGAGKKVLRDYRFDINKS